MKVGRGYRKLAEEVLPVAKVELLENGQVGVTPVSRRDDYFAFIYRSGAGVEWNSKNGYFLSPSKSMLTGRKSYTVVQNVEALATGLAWELGLQLQFSADTIWLGIPDDMRTQLEASYGPAQRPPTS